MIAKAKMVICADVTVGRRVLRTGSAGFLLMAFLVAFVPAVQAVGPPADAASAAITAPLPLPDAPSAVQVPAQGAFGGLGTVAKTIGSDQLHLLKYPFQKKAIKWDVLFLGATAVLIANDESVLHQVPQSWHNTSVTLSNASLGADAGIAGGIFVTGLITHNDHATQTGMRSAEAAVDSVILLEAAKLVFTRQRPNTGEGEGKFFSGNWSSGSFPSGHSMFTWTIASTVAHEYHSPWVKVLVYGLAATVSTSRVTAREHFPSDVFVGSVIGYGVGAYVAGKDKYSKVNGHTYSEGRASRWEHAVLQHVTLQ
jgi:membrane-associated phospholipid phosphatase